MPISQPLPNTSDSELLQQVAAGENEAFKELYARYNLQIFNYILRLIHQPPVAEDILQEVFLAVWQGAGRFRGKSSVKTWVFRIAHNQTVSWLRKQKKLAQTIENIDDIPLLNGDLLPEEQLIEQWRASQVREAVEQLSYKHRSVIELTFVHGFAYKEIARIMGCPIGTVKSRMSYALRYLETKIEKM